MREFTTRIKEELLKPLPGEPAQKLMSPTVRNIRPYSQDEFIDPIPSGVLVLLYQQGDDQVKFPLIQRPVYNGAHSGQIALPGGKMEKRDASVIETALRETQEEIGINPKHVEILGKLSELYIWASNHTVTPVVGWLHEIPSFKPDPLEVAGILSADLNVLNPVNPVQTAELLVRNSFKIQAPYYSVEGQVVWGATAMMLSEFSVLLRQAGIFEV